MFDDRAVVAHGPDFGAPERGGDVGDSITCQFMHGKSIRQL